MAAFDMGFLSFLKNKLGIGKPAADLVPVSKPTANQLPTLETPIFGRAWIGNIIGIVIAASIADLAFAEINSSRTSYTILRLIYGSIYPRHLTFKINLYKYGIARRRKIVCFAGQRKVPLRKLGWRIIAS